MTLSPENRTVQQSIIDCRSPMFMLWAIRYGVWRLFPIAPDDDPLIIKLYVMARKLGQDVEKVLKMPSKMRDALYNLEKQLIEESQSGDEPT